LSHGNFMSGDSITIAKHKVSLRGMGWATRLKLADGMNKDMIVLGDGVTVYIGITIADLALDGNKANQTTAGHGISGNRTQDLTIEHMLIEECFLDGIYIKAKTSQYNSLINCTINRCGEDGIELDDTCHFQIVRAQVRYCGRYGYFGNYSGTIFFDASQFFQCERGAYVLGDDGNQFVNCIFQECSREGLLIEGSTRVVVSDCSFPYNAPDALAALYLQSDWITVSNSHVWNTKGNHAGIRIHYASSDCVIRGNTSTDTREIVDEKTQLYGIYIEPGASRLVIEGNQVTGNKTANIYDGGAVDSVIRRNPGYPTENMGIQTFSGDGVTTSFTFAHGLVATPKHVDISFASADARVAGPVHWSADATNITVTFNTAPASGTDNVVFSWRAWI